MQARKTWNPGDIPTALDFNNAVRDSAIFGVGYPIVGGAPFPSGSGFLIQGGQFVGTTNIYGGIGFNWPSPFPNGVLSAMVMVGDASQANIGYAAGIGGQTTLTGWGGIIAALPLGSSLTSTMVRLSFIVIGW